MSRHGAGFRRDAAAGRGRALREAGECPVGELLEVVRASVHEEGRDFPSLEDRNWYLAALLCAANVPANVMLEAVLGPAGRLDADQVELQCDVLMSLAQRGVHAAGLRLEQELEHGAEWARAATALAGVYPQDVAGRLQEAVHRRLRSAPEDGEWSWRVAVHEEPWRTWTGACSGARPLRIRPDLARFPSLDWAKAIADPAIVFGPAWQAGFRKRRAFLEFVTQGRDVGWLVEQARSGHSEARTLAYSVLSGKDPSLPIEEAINAFVSAQGIPERRSIGEYVRALPLHQTRPRIRPLLQGSRWHVLLALSALRDGFVAEDASAVLRLLEEALQEEHMDIPLVSNAVQALGATRGPGAREMIERICDVARCALIRADALIALLDLPGTERRPCVVDALWDAQERSRLAAVRAVDASVEGVSRRLQEMAADPSETADVRALARARID